MKKSKKSKKLIAIQKLTGQIMKAIDIGLPYSSPVQKIGRLAKNKIVLEMKDSSEIICTISEK